MVKLILGKTQNKVIIEALMAYSTSGYLPIAKRRIANRILEKLGFGTSKS